MTPEIMFFGILAGMFGFFDTLILLIIIAGLSGQTDDRSSASCREIANE